jgi:hypothetical protein
MYTIAFPLIYLMVALNPVTGQWEGVNSKGAFDDTEPAVYTDQKTCLAARQEMAAPGIYFCLAYKDPQYMMEILQNGHWLPLDGRGMTYGSGHGVSNVSYPSEKACLADRPVSDLKKSQPVWLQSCRRSLAFRTASLRRSTSGVNALEGMRGSSTHPVAAHTHTLGSCVKPPQA